MSEVSSIATQTAARIEAERRYPETQASPYRVRPAMIRAFIEGALWFAEHQPARVVPSAEAVQAVVARIVAPYVSGPLDPLDVKVTDAIFALVASQATVAEVREQVAREVRRFADVSDPDFGALTADERAAIRAAANFIARTETKGSE